MRTQTPTSIAVLEGLHNVPTPDAVTNAHIRDVVGNKADTASSLVNTTTSLVAYLKSVLIRQAVPSADIPWNSTAFYVSGNKEDTARTTVGTTRSIMSYVKGILNTVVASPNMIAFYEGNDSSTAYTTHVEVSGAWRLYEIAIDRDGTNFVIVKITMDGSAPVYARAQSAGVAYVPALWSLIQQIAEPGAETTVATKPVRDIIAEGSTSLKIEMKSDAVANHIVKVIYAG